MNGRLLIALRRRPISQRHRAPSLSVAARKILGKDHVDAVETKGGRSGSPVTELDQRFSGPGAEATPWDDARRAIEKAEVFWISTVRADRRPHRPTAKLGGQP